MLSKSQARLFFVVGTLCFSGVFLWLTIDTVLQVPAQTKSDQITPAVTAGKVVWEDNNCMGCHTIFGEGAYYAPELTKVYERRGAPWLRVFLKDPQAMFPGERKMTNYHLTEAQISDVIAFLQWAGKVDLNGFPKKPTLSTNTPLPTPSEVDAANAAPAVFTQICTACHAVGGKGGNVGPALDGVASRLDKTTLFSRVKNPKSVQADAKMPTLGLPDSDINSVVTYLETLK